MANAGMKGRPIVPLMLSALDVGIRSVFYLAIIPGPLAFLLVLLVKETPAAVPPTAARNTWVP